MIIILLLIVIILMTKKPRAVRKAEKRKARKELNDDFNRLVDKVIAKMKGSE